MREKSRLVVSSHKQYGKTLQILIDSLKKQNFDTTKIVVVVAAAENDELFQTKDWIQINYSKNNFEYSSYEGIAHHFENPLIAADQYIFLHDTCWIGPDFISKIADLPRFTKIHKFGGEINSNINAVPAKYIPLLKNRFSHIISKTHAVAIECGSFPPSFKGSFFYTEGPARTFVREEDVYGTGHPRRVFHYEDLDLYKAIAWDLEGDILGQARSTIRPREEAPKLSLSQRIKKFPPLRMLLSLRRKLISLGTKIANEALVSFRNT